MNSTNVLEGKVVSLSGTKTVIVSVVHNFRHPLYKKAVKRMKRFAVHNEGKELAVGDVVKIVETRPISKNKHYKIV
ncbi:MAG: 30S ribosomal protein S17 [Candidatus Gottesmanbacteria bacterium GW2011_GWB1_49_7]|uniref:30S ribosomal protein S17 n=1 Tax=Candidatus Gottesmanbacteria bacterium GW2011_GWB1_49_7 TaxID=1618448 RepID=A0A0G1Y950_9BACT|nr:MAG: 30S ribosomal protein S17, small subunit ribosomal protein S17 [Microgenomates group bacterium GW2011_GWC1_49_7]KKW11427.1 MAG: 30S ribosomal protein S17 [Candidatus Gottesmanbacteria bacterium GW2011_GWB1_49_7]